MIFITNLKTSFKKVFDDLLPQIQFNEDQVIVPWEVLRVYKSD